MALSGKYWGIYLFPNVSDVGRNENYDTRGNPKHVDHDAGNWLCTIRRWARTFGVVLRKLWQLEYSATWGGRAHFGSTRDGLDSRKANANFKLINILR
jgi:hypothetical protein